MRFIMNSVFRGLIVCFCLLLSAPFSPVQARHWMDIGQNRLNGPVQKVAEEQMLLQAEGKAWVRIPLRIVIYNREGNAVKFRTYRGAQEFEEKGYIYDDAGHVVSSGSFSKDGSFILEMLSRYSPEGLLEESRYFSQSSGSLFLIKKYSYRHAKLVKEIHLSADGAVIAVKEYLYDASGQSSGVITSGKDGKVLAREMVSNDGKGIDCEYSGDLQNYGRRIKIRTEADGRLEETCYLPDGSVYKNQICDTREGDGVKRVVHRGDGSIAAETLYNSSGDVISVSRFLADGSLQGEEKFTYQYDAWGNWTERAVSKREHSWQDWTDTEKTLKEITYF